MRTTTLAAVALSGLVLSACTGPADDEPTRNASAPVTIAELDPAESLTPAGEVMLESSDFGAVAPRIEVTAEADPVSGEIEGVVRAELPVGTEVDEVDFRYFAGLASFEAAPADAEVTVDGEPAASTRDTGLLTVELPEGHGGHVTVEVPFAYTLPEAPESSILDALGGSLEPAKVGLLARHPDQLSLGHWFPIWVPEGLRNDATPKGYGDIGNFPAADITLRLTVPAGWTVIDGGVRADAESNDGTSVVTSYGTGMRDLSVAVVRDFVSETRDVGDVAVTAWGPRDSESELAAVLDETEAAIEVLSEALGGFPWREYDVISTPLGGGVAGMEWPGATWIESSLFAGGLPGLGDLGELGELGELVGPLLESLGGLSDGARAWTIAHEVAHSWWTILVGNDSIASPVVDEPLAQYSACLVLRATSDDADELCKTQIVSGYSTMKLFGDEDGQADRATDEFDSPTQYGGLIYGKAAWFYVAMEQIFGADRIRDALRALVTEHAFDTITGDDVRAVLVAQLGKRAGKQWDRWMHEAHGDEDLPAVEGGGLGGLDGLDGLEGLDGVDLEQLLELLGQLGG